MLRLQRLAIALSLFAATAAPGLGQSGQYTAPGALGTHPLDARAALFAAVDEARWRLGPIRLDPWLGVRDVAWVKNPNEKGDLTVAVGAGLRAYLPVGSRLVFTAHALPEYIWWRDRSQDSRIGGRAGLGMFYYANRFGLELKASSSDLDNYVTPEVQRRTQVDSRALEGRLDVPVGRRLALFVRGSHSETDVTEPDPAFAELENLDSTTETLEGGVRFLLTRDLSIGVGAGSSDTRFDPGARDRSNDGDYTVVDVAWTRPKLGASFSTRRYDLRPKAGSEFEGYDGSAWNGSISWQPRRSLSLAVYGQRALVYSVLGDASYFQDDRAGLRVGLPLGSRLALSVYVEDGRHDYSDGRRDDVQSWGGTLGGPLWRRLRFDVSANNTSIDGDLGRRQVREIGLRVSLGTDGLSWF